MEYKLNTTNYRDFKVIEDNKLAGRAYFIPYSKKEKLCAVDLRHERTDSDLVEVLSGEAEAECGFYGAVCDIEMADGLFADIGGASTELALLTGGQLQKAGYAVWLCSDGKEADAR